MMVDDVLDIGSRRMPGLGGVGDLSTEMHEGGASMLLFLQFIPYCAILTPIFASTHES